MELTPAHVLRALAPEVELDGELSPGWRLFDAAWLDEGVLLEVRHEEGETMWLGVELLDPGHGGPRRLFVRHRRDRWRRLGGDPEAARRTCDRLQQQLGSLAWTRAVARSTDAREIGREVGGEALGAEWAALRGSLRAWERRVGRAPRVLEIAPDAHAIGFPDPSTHAHLPGGYWWSAPRSFLERRAFRDYLAGLGFRADADGVVRTVPTPASFMRLAARQGLPAPALVPVLRETWRPSLPGRRWLSFVLRGELPINVLPERLYTLYLATGRTPLRWIDLGLQVTDLGELAHDMGVHVLAMHRLPRSFLDDLRGWTRARLGGASRRAVEGLVGLFEGELTRACQETWQGLDAPGEFEAAFQARRPELEERLAARFPARSGRSPGRAGDALC
jgi:hypothetical protein